MFAFKLIGKSVSELKKIGEKANAEEIANLYKKTVAVGTFVLSGILTTDVKVQTESDSSKKFIVTVTLKKWDDVKLSGEAAASYKEIYDSIQGKEKEKVEIAINLESIKAIYDKQ